MNIEDELFNKYRIDKSKLIKYGFIKDNKNYIYKKNILDDKFTIVVEYNKKIKGKIIEIEFNDEYTNFRRENLGEFSSNIKNEFINLLVDIRNKCTSKDTFNFDQTKRINNLIMEKYEVFPEFLWEKFPSYAIYRKTKKWFALIGSVGINKIDKNSDSTTEVEIINLKISPNNINELLNKKGIYEAYHMNKKNWITIILDNTLTDEDIMDYIEESYNLVNK